MNAESKETKFTRAVLCSLGTRNNFRVREKSLKWEQKVLDVHKVSGTQPKIVWGAQQPGQRKGDRHFEKTGDQVLTLNHVERAAA